MHVMKRGNSLLLVMMSLGALTMTSCKMPDQGVRVASRVLFDWQQPLSIPKAGSNDVSRLHARTSPTKVLKLSADPAKAEQQLRGFLAEARSSHASVSVAGARHSMGGQTIAGPQGFTIDMLGLNHIGTVFQRGGRSWVTVGAGARWKEIIPQLRRAGFAPMVMQSNSDFTVGGSISVNCHGWQHNSEPIASTVASIRLMTADGVVRQCSRKEDAELFSAAMGGYGLFGVILEATLEVVRDEQYQACETKDVPPSEYVARFEKMTQGNTNGMAYGRINVAPGSSFLNKCIVTVLRPVDGEKEKHVSWLPSWLLNRMKRAVFRNAVDNPRGKEFRQLMENEHGETVGRVQRRSDILSEPAALFGNRDPHFTEILHEYFVPKHQLGRFLEKMRAIHASSPCPDLLNITVRNVKPDHTVLLRYAREEVFGLVMLFHQRRDSSADTLMQPYTQRMIDAVLACGGAYYLPYRLHARRDQFERAYPMSDRFFALKRRYDPHGLFQNQFYLRYAPKD